MDEQLIERHKRSIDIINPELLDFPIHILGAGGIGSWTALLLAKMGCSDIVIYDDDRVEDHNVASQFFMESQLGHKKNTALAYNIFKQTGIKAMAFPISMEKEIKEGLLIIAIDSMERRHRINEKLKDKVDWIIDGRMGGTQLEIYSQSPSNYYKTLVDPNGVEHDLCTAKSICFNCAVIGGLIANYVRLYVNGNTSNHAITFGFNHVELLKE
jgi:molybdopterin/thiamine biosynthesis adenylyltransferase